MNTHFLKLLIVISLVAFINSCSCGNEKNESDNPDPDPKQSEAKKIAFDMNIY